MQVSIGHAETTPPALMLKYNVPVNVPLDFIKAQKVMEVENLSKADKIPRTHGGKIYA
jgi:hypothetical protein